MSVFALITARGGSKGIPRKNVLGLAGKPLIAWTIEAACKSTGVGRVIVSTDDKEIARVAREWGADVPFMRPRELAQDNSPHIDSVLHAIRWLRDEEQATPQYWMLLQPTSPLRSSVDIDAAIEIANSFSAPAVVSVSEMPAHPYLAKTIDEQGHLKDLVPSNIAYLRRQSLPPAYVLNGAIYLQSTESWLSRKQTTPSDSRPYVMPISRSLDIDDQWEWYLAATTLKQHYSRAAA